MAESKFLPHQDVNGDGLIDICGEAPPIEVGGCVGCVPNLCAIVPNWRELKVYQPFLNEKICKFQIAKITKHQTTGAPEGASEAEAAVALNKIFDEYVDGVLRILLDIYNKDNSDESVATIKAVTEYTDWDLNFRPKSRVKILYSVPYDDLMAIADAEPADEPEEEETTDITVTYLVDGLYETLIRQRKGLHLYSRHAKVWSATESDFFVREDDASFFDLELYGDAGGLMGSTLIKKLEKFLNSKGYRIPYVGGPNWRKELIKSLTFTFSAEYELKRIDVYTEACPLDPIHLYGSKLDSLKSNQSWKDPTAMAYFAALYDMENDLIARTPLNWIEFVKKYTYPAVVENSTVQTEPNVLGCIGTALTNEAKELGQDILDATFGLADAIVYKFHKNLCRNSLTEVTKDDIKSGIWPDEAPNPNDPTGPTQTVRDLARAQAFAQLEASEQTFRFLCYKLELAAEIDPGPGFSGMMAYEFNKMIDDLTWCGLLDMFTAGIECLLGGLTLEEGLAAMLKAALSTMSIENFGKLFVGLPPEQQAELDAMVKDNLESGNIFKPGSGMDTASDDVMGNYSAQRSWEDPEVIRKERENLVDGITTGQSETFQEDYRETLAPTSTGTVTETLTGGSASGQLDSNIVMQAYGEALLEMFKGKELELVDKFNEFPGAQLLSNVFATTTCPHGPFFQPSFMDFIRDFELPVLCGRRINFPRMNRPIEIPWRDIMGELFEAVSASLLELRNIILVKIFVMLCEILGDAICKALEVMGDVAVGLISQKHTVKELIKESICGDDVSDETLEDTIAELFATFGVGGAALADTEATLTYAADLGSVLTESEVESLFLGNPAGTTTKLAWSLAENEHPHITKALSGEKALANAFKNMGNVLPAEFKQELRDRMDTLPKNNLVSANPTLCLTPEQVDEFCDLRAQLLAGRATPEQIKKLCERDPQQLEDVASMMNKLPLDCIPPLISDPGCDNGLLPYEPEAGIETTTAALGNQLEALKAEFSTDMLGNGPGKANWGMVNMILSDTMANPLTAHYRKSFNMDKYVDFYKEYNPSLDLTGIVSVSETLMVTTNPAAITDSIWNFVSAAPLKKQRGAFPLYVAEWLQREMGNLNTAYSSNNEWVDDQTFTKTFDELKDLNKGSPLKGGIYLPDFGYNYTFDVDGTTDTVLFTKLGRKKTPELEFDFKDNCKGLRTGPNGEQSEWSYGFKVELYVSDLEYNESEFGYQGVRSRPSDNARIRIINYFNQSAHTDFNQAMIADPEEYKSSRLKPNEKEVLADMHAEFYSADDTFGEVEVKDYPTFLTCFESKHAHSPPVVLMAEMLGISAESAKGTHDAIMTSVTNDLVALVATNQPAFNYGAEYDALTQDQTRYVVDEGQTLSPGGTSYGDAEVSDENGGTRGIANRDQILGISRMEWQIKSGQIEDENRVFYLSPETYGGRYINPPLYIKPLKNKGWLGLVDVLFPDFSPCKPHTTELIDFGQIQNTIDEEYPNVPEDERLQQDIDCALEVPYNRILTRDAVSGLQGLITAAVRIYATTHFIKSMASFITFYPKFPGNFSSLYAAYIVEDMEESFKDAQPDGLERFSFFKDEEFWYAFLEQSVQMYARRVESGDIEDPPKQVLLALTRLNQMQLDYERKDRTDLRIDRKDDETDRIFLKNYKSDLVFGAVRETEEDAKIVLTELVSQELNYMGEKFAKNLDIVGMTPLIFDLGYYLLESMAQGNTLTLNKFLETTYGPLPTAPPEASDEPYYTYGGEFVVGEDNDSTDEFSLGDEYIGEYHVYVGEGGEVTYMSGPEHFEEEPHDILYPMANMMSIPIGDVPEYDYTGWTSSTSQPFVVEKYISINGTKTNPTTAVSTIKARDPSLNISDVYPGDLELVYDDNDSVIGLSGELGIRHGLEFSIILNGSKRHVTSVEIDALDTTIGKFEAVGADNKLLLCLIDHLKEDDKFKLMSRYIFPLSKITSTVAVYNNMGFFASIGEVTVKDGETAGIFPGGGINDIPGARAVVEMGQDPETREPYISDVSVVGNEGWAGVNDRSRASPMIKKWDEWDQILLRNSKKLIKRQFRGFYNSRDFDIGDLSGKGRGPAQVYLNRLKERISPSPGERLLGWWRKRRLTGNPFNADGDLCEK